MALRPGGQMIQSAEPTRSQLMPLLTKYKELPSKSQLIPAVLTIIVIMLLFMHAGDHAPIIFKNGSQDPLKWTFTSYYIIILGSYLVLLSLQFLCSLAGKQKSWFALLGVMGFTIAFMQLGPFDLIYPLFHGLLAGGEVQKTDSLPVQLWKHFAGTGFLEELSKAVPVLLLAFFATKLSPAQRRKFGVEEPLDGILLAAASAGGFVLIETIGQYVSNALRDHWINLAYALTEHRVTDPRKLLMMGMDFAGAAPGLQLLIPRALRSCFGHMAYSGYFGYFIGLAMLKPAMKFRILAVGFLSASFVHALWDTIPGDMVKIGIAVLCYALLMAAILKARELSPNQSILQPSVVLGYSLRPRPAGAAAPVATPAYSPTVPAFALGMNALAPAGGPAMPLALPPAFQTVALPPVPAAGPLTMRIGMLYLAIQPGLRIFDVQIPGLQPSVPGGAVAEVVTNPNDPSALGLLNSSRSVWEFVSASGNRYQLQPGQTVKIARGARFGFGMIDGEIR